MNRGIARRTVFEASRDVRFFLSRLARAVRANWIEVHAYCVMTTHFHLLLRSNEGGLSLAMTRVQHEYVRWFNRGRKRDGSLFRGRFRSRRVDSLEYRKRLVRYIDDNPVLAGIVSLAEDYPHGSAHLYARERGPLWLERRWIEEEVRARTGASNFDPALYSRCFGPRTTPALARVVERRIENGARGPDPLDDLLGAAPGQVLNWMRRKAALADGTELCSQLCDAADVANVIALHRARRAEWPLLVTRQSSSGWTILEVALRRDLCASTWSEIGAVIEISEQGAARAYQLHRRAIGELPQYADTIAGVAAEVIARCYGDPACVGPGDRTAMVSDEVG